MALVQSRILLKSSLLSSTPQLGCHWPGGISSGLRQQQRAPAASILPTTLSAVSRHPSPRWSLGLPSGSEVCHTWNNGCCTSSFSMQTTSRVQQLSRPVSQSQQPPGYHLLSFTLSLPFPPSRWDLLPHLPSPAAISPLSFSALTSKLMGHPSSSVRQYLLSVFRHGFRIDYDPSCIARLQFTSQNMQSVLQNTQVVDE